jgi:hypothetical protein
MNDEPRYRFIPAWVALILILSCGQTVLAQGTAFAYQGKLTDSGSPATGQYDFQFSLYDALMGGAQQGSTVTVASVVVTAGIFTAQLDFGACASCFDGTARFLEIAVKKTLPAGMLATGIAPVTALPLTLLIWLFLLSCSAAQPRKFSFLAQGRQGQLKSWMSAVILISITTAGRIYTWTPGGLRVAENGGG